MSEDIFADPWLKQAEQGSSLPNDALFACAYELYINPFEMVQASFLRRTETRDELWILDDPPLASIREIAAGNASPGDIELGDVRTGCACAVPRKGEELPACLNLLDLLFHIYVGFCWPSEFVVPGIVNESAFNGLLERIERELEDNTNKARQRETEIIKVARELGLHPRPTGTGPDYWRATCPGTSHPLFIKAAESFFGCGWCKRKGSTQELRAFAEERRRERTSDPSGRS